MVMALATPQGVKCATELEYLGILVARNGPFEVEPRLGMALAGPPRIGTPSDADLRTR
jgi:hypothetical protein